MSALTFLPFRATVCQPRLSHFKAMLFLKIVRRVLLMMAGKERLGVRTNRVVFEHAQRLMRSRPLHCAVVARHGHRDEAHHNGT